MLLRGLVTASISLALAGPAVASEPLSDMNGKDATLAVNSKGEALITYKRESGAVRRVLVWGAVNALTPNATVPQARFKYDYAGGWGKYRKLYWKTFKSTCRKYDGPRLPYTIASCKASGFTGRPARSVTASSRRSRSRTTPARRCGPPRRVSASA